MRIDRPVVGWGWSAGSRADGVRLGAIGLLLSAAMALVASPGCSKQQEAKAPITGDLRQVVAEVNGEKILLADVSNAVNMLKTGRVPNVDPNASDLDLQKRAVDDLISQRLLFLEAKKLGTIPTEQEAQDALAQYAQQQGMSDSVFAAELAKINLTREDFVREWTRTQGVNRYVVKAIQDTIQVTPEQARAYFDSHPEEFHRPEMVHARHILIKADENATPEMVAQAQVRVFAAHRELVSGGDFAELARQLSEDTGSASNGGDLGFFRRGQFPAPFDSIAFALAPGTVSEPFRSGYGWHIVRAEERKPEGQLDFSEVDVNRLRMMLLQMRTYDRVQGLIAELKSGAKIKRKV